MPQVALKLKLVEADSILCDNSVVLNRLLFIDSVTGSVAFNM